MKIHQQKKMVSYVMGQGAPTNKTIASAFESTVVTLHPKPDEPSITAAWSYTNHWDFPLAVERFDTSCGCLSGHADHETLQPGQSGKLTAAFAPGQHRGLLRKSLHVKFIGHDKPVELVVEATIPSSVEISTRELTWNAGEAPEPRAIDVTSGTGKPFTITGLQGVPEALFTITQETIAPGKHYQIRITPQAPPVEGSQCLQIRTDSADSRDQLLAIFLTTKPSPAVTSARH